MHVVTDFFHYLVPSSRPEPPASYLPLTSPRLPHFHCCLVPYHRCTDVQAAEIMHWHDANGDQIIMLLKLVPTTTAVIDAMLA